MIKIDFTNILNKALEISNTTKVKVKEFNENQNLANVKPKELTYLQLGIVLIQSQEQIKEVHIIYKE